MAMVDTQDTVKIDEKIKIEITEPKRYKVLFLNDDKTPMEFVIELLMTIFKHSRETAEQITLTVHSEGSGIAGVYTYEIAEQKGVEATHLSRQAGFPLQIKVDAE
jgi:ATP-dependent Clp protease adaptor protein ClpS